MATFMPPLDHVRDAPFSERKVLEALHALEALVGRDGRWPDGSVDFARGHGVAFPDCDWEPRRRPRTGRENWSSTLRLAAGGRRVLFLCFNRPLGQHLRAAVEAGGPHAGSVDVRTFHHLGREMWEKAGRAWDEPAPGTPPEEAAAFWKEETARRLGEALQVVPERWDALVVDEAQDFETTWWETLH